MKQKVDDICLKFADFIIGDGKGAVDFFFSRRRWKKDSTVIYDGVDEDLLVLSTDVREKRMNFAPNGETIISVIARLDDNKKGQSEMLRAMPSLMESFGKKFKGSYEKTLLSC